MSQKKIGIYGGSFDPIHIAHLILAECCRESLQLDEVRFVPANISPLKQSGNPLDGKHRVEMLRLAIRGNEQFILDTRELDRAGVSYTIDTVQSMAQEFPDAELILLMGADSLMDIAKWKSPEQLLSLVSIGAIARGGVGEPPWEALRPFVSEARWKQIQRKVTAPSLDLSSSNLRQRIRDGLSIRYQLPESVEDYIKQHQLYSS
ncbi:MAG: nicotinate-nucleotide adenylyltransferase [Pirellula sp.]|jgi:nicotinate-nucleotide adenylyltransferase|nr:nicotinate-nucleotide adenylyltransferase [Pirellula sp.]